MCPCSFRLVVLIVFASYCGSHSELKVVHRRSCVIESVSLCLRGCLSPEWKYVRYFGPRPTMTYKVCLWWQRWPQLKFGAECWLTAKFRSLKLDYNLIYMLRILLPQDGPWSNMDLPKDLKYGESLMMRINFSTFVVPEKAHDMGEAAAWKFTKILEVSWFA